MTEKQPKKFVFVITDGTELLMSFGYGENIEVATEYLTKGLNEFWSIVEDEEVIKSFIIECRLGVDPNNLPDRLAKQWLEYEEDLNRLESRLTPLSKGGDNMKKIYSTSFVANELGITRGHVTKLVNAGELQKPYYHMIDSRGHEVNGWTMAQIEEMKATYFRKRK